MDELLEQLQYNYKVMQAQCYRLDAMNKNHNQLDIDMEFTRRLLLKHGRNVKPNDSRKSN